MRIVSVEKGGQAERGGVKAGDRIVGINGHRVRDQIDLIFYGSDDDVMVTFHRGTYENTVRFDGSGDFGFELEPMDIRRCGNACVFCFIDQNPTGLRDELYVKDEDYRLSFLHGTYVTLTRLREEDLVRIVRQRLSPLYVSVHATDTAKRLKLLGIGRDDHLMDNMDRLLAAGISMHCQIVVCPGINDGDVLHRTVTDLRRRYPGVCSVAVVPVGLTKHRAGLCELTPVDERCARETIVLVDRLHGDYAAETGEGFVYCADEWYIRAGLDIPDESYYDDFPQIENGVGMVRDFIGAVSRLEDVDDADVRRRGRFVFVTGVSMSSLMEDFAGRVSACPGIRARVVTVVNEFFGDTVTVSGLLTGQDILAALEGVENDETVVLPPNCLNTDGVFLDDMKPAELSETLGVEVVSGDYDPVNLFFETH